jgi:ribosomal protein S18 acetylase RimI-like enzyme
MQQRAITPDSAAESELDNPVWSCLSTRHAGLAQGGELAKRYPPDISPLAGAPGAGAANVAALEALFEVGEILATAGPFMPALSARWETLHESLLVQMIRRTPTPMPEAGADISALSVADAPEMLALVELTQPGPFRSRTAELGNYVGIRREGRLVAMAGERMWIGDHREISAVCTHPDARGHRHARALMSVLVNRMLRAGQIPFLHVECANVRAIALYRTLGFVERAQIPLRVARLTTGRPVA